MKRVAPLHLSARNTLYSSHQNRLMELHQGVRSLLCGFPTCTWIEARNATFHFNETMSFVPQSIFFNSTMGFGPFDASDPFDFWHVALPNKNKASKANFQQINASFPAIFELNRQLANFPANKQRQTPIPEAKIYKFQFPANF